VSRDQIYELLAHLVTSAELCTREPGYYGTFRLIDAASRLLAAAEASGAGDEWLAAARREIDEKKVLMMSDRERYYAFLPAMSRMVGERLLERSRESGS
jgi:hypothetical protein